MSFGLRVDKDVLNRIPKTKIIRGILLRRDEGVVSRASWGKFKVWLKGWKKLFVISKYKKRRKSYLDYR